MDLNALALGIDMGGTKIATGLVSADGSLLAKTKGLNKKDSAETILDCIMNQVDQVIETLEYQMSSVRGVGFSIPAVIDRDRGIIKWAPNIPALNNFPLRDVLEKRLRLPVYLGFDGHMAALGEHWVGVGKDVRNMILLIIGTGVGGAIIADGRLIFGSTGQAGAFGWMVHGEAHPKSFKLGWLEGQTAGPWILELAQSKGHFSTTEEVFAEAALGNKTAQEVIRHVGELLGRALSSLVSALDTELVVLTGGVGSKGQLLVPVITDCIKKYSQPYIADRVSVKVSQLGAEAAILGAAKVVFDANQPTDTNGSHDEGRPIDDFGKRE